MRNHKDSNNNGTENSDKANRVTMAFELFSFFESKNIDYCVLGNTENYSSTINSDVDIAVSKKNLRHTPEILLSFCKNNNYQLIQHFQHEVTAAYYVIADYSNPENVVFLHPDICSDYIRNGKKFITAKTLLANCKLKTNDGGGFYVPSAENEFIYYLIKKIDKGSLTKESTVHLQSQWKQEKEAATELIHRYWSNTNDAQIIEDCAQTSDWTPAEKNINRLRNGLTAPYKNNISDFLLETKRKASRYLYPSGLFIAFFGPDGSGKTSVINETENILSEVFRKTHKIHLRPRLGKKNTGDEVPADDPHGKPIRGQFLSFLKLLYLAADYIGGYLLRVRPMLVRSTLVIFDRYYQDILVDATRYRHGNPAWVTRLIEIFIPQPDLIILLDAPAEVLQSRKQEVPYKESERQREAYRKVLAKYPHSVVVDSSQPLELVVADTTKAILNHLGKRFESTKPA